MPKDKLDASNTCPYSGEECTEYGSGHCSYECSDNPDYEDDDEE